MGLKLGRGSQRSLRSLPGPVQQGWGAGRAAGWAGSRAGGLARAGAQRRPLRFQNGLVCLCLCTGAGVCMHTHGERNIQASLDC